MGGAAAYNVPHAVWFIEAWKARKVLQSKKSQEAEYNAFKLSYLNSAVASGEGELIWPPAPYHWSDDGEHDAEMLLMPLEEYQKVKTACGIQDETPANKWFKSVLQALIDVLWLQFERSKSLFLLLFFLNVF